MSAHSAQSQKLDDGEVTIDYDVQLHLASDLMEMALTAADEDEDEAADVEASDFLCRSIAILLGKIEVSLERNRDAALLATLLEQGNELQKVSGGDPFTTANVSPLNETCNSGWRTRHRRTPWPSSLQH